MKKSLLILVSAMLALGGQAVTLTPEEALARLNSSRKAAPAVSVSSLDLITEGSYEGTPTYYVFSNNKQAFIMSADDAFAPVIGYLDNPVTADMQMPPQLVGWLEEVGRAMKIASESGVVYEPAVGTSKAATKGDVAPLVTSKWNQDAPYNNLCPTSGGKKCYTGCVATAMAQIMNFWKYPEIGTGTCTLKTNGVGNGTSLDLSKQAFDWANMLDVYRSGAYNSVQGEAVAYLMEACGYSVNMGYGTNASGTQSELVGGALIDNFNYDSGIQSLCPIYYSPSAWEDILYNEVSNGRPILYSGTGAGGGHAFVCDGYQTSTNMFHFNWGWGGSYDGYFVYSNLNPQGGGIGSNDDNTFSFGQSALIGIQKPTGNNAKRQAGNIGCYSSSSNVVRLTAQAGNGRSVVINVNDNTGESGFMNTSITNFNGHIGYTLESKTGGKNYTKNSGKVTLEIGYYYPNLTFNISTDVEDGTYKFMPCFSSDNGVTWTPFLTAYGYTPEITLTVTKNAVQVEGTFQAVNDVQVASCVLPDFIIGKECSVVATFKNNGSKSFSKPIICNICTQSGSDYTVVSQFARTKGIVSLRANATSAEQTFTGTIPTDMTPGVYYLTFEYSGTDGNELIGATKIAIGSDGSGVDSITDDTNWEEAEMYDLQGRRVNRETAAPGIYILKAGDKTSKIMVR